MLVTPPILRPWTAPQDPVQGKDPDRIYRVLDEKAAIDLPLDSFTVDEVLTTLPGPKSKPFPASWEGKKARIQTTALLWLEGKIAAELAAGTFKRDDGPLQQAIRTILDLPLEEVPYHVMTSALEVSALLNDPLSSPQLVRLLRHPWEGVVEGAATALAKRRGDQQALVGVENLWRDALTSQVGEFSWKKIFEVQHSQGLRPWGRALEGLMENHEKLMQFLDDIDEVPLSLERIQAFPLTGAGVRCLIFDRRFFANHMDFGGRLRVNRLDDADTDHGTAVGSVLTGRVGGVAPGAEVEGYSSETTIIDSLEASIARLDLERVAAQAGRPFARVLVISGYPNLHNLDAKEMPAYQKTEARWFQAVKAAYGVGIIPLISAGNFYLKDEDTDPVGGQLPPYSRSPFILRIGAAVRTDLKSEHWRAAHYSGRGGSAFLPSFCAPTNRLAAWYETYDVFDGTSCATPFAAGVVALMLEANPKLTAAEVFDILMATCKPLEGEGPEQTGWGLIDPSAAIEKAYAKRDANLAAKFRQFLN